MSAALTLFQGVGVNPLSQVGCRTSPDKGRYLKAFDSTPEVRVFLQRRVYVFRLRKPTAPVCDWLLTAEIHQLDSEKLETEKLELLIWVFWYCPTQAAIAQAEKYLQNLPPHQRGLLVYLQVSADETDNLSTNRLLLYHLPEPIAVEGFSPIVHRMAEVIQTWMSHYSGHSCNK